ncbi:hypothetical protein [Streptomonospora litoralis]|uniref:Uncharacterized protein n=1 Tax=Streptomonospora litoralis TaxID=2498135 RepID=A0A4P6Q7G6_9ACTN|nr:hypothetical protein [Streptomonospora litoralis]QBI54767.1 hypothetical protein EKD16_14945 [Streptomonospora litoralis]
MEIGTAELIIMALLLIGIPTIFVTVAALMRRRYRRSTRGDR